MTVKDLRELIKDVADETPVICFPAAGEGFYPSAETSGVSEFGEPCNENGVPYPDNLNIPPMLALFDEHFEMEEEKLGES